MTSKQKGVAGKLSWRQTGGVGQSTFYSVHAGVLTAQELQELQEYIFAQYIQEELSSVLTANELQELQEYTLLSTGGNMLLAVTGFTGVARVAGVTGVQEKVCSVQNAQAHSLWQDITFSYKSYRSTRGDVQCAQTHTHWQDVTCSYRSSVLESSYSRIHEYRRRFAVCSSSLTVARCHLQLQEFLFREQLHELQEYKIEEVCTVIKLSVSLTVAIYFSR